MARKRFIMSIFTHNKERSVKGSYFNMSHEVKLTCDMPFWFLSSAERFCQVINGN